MTTRLTIALRCLSYWTARMEQTDGERAVVATANARHYAWRVRLLKEAHHDRPAA